MFFHPSSPSHSSPSVSACPLLSSVVQKSGTRRDGRTIPAWDRRDSARTGWTAPTTISRRGSANRRCGDNYFGDPRADQEGHPGTFIRWKLDFRFEEDEGFAFRTRIHAQVRVPRVTRRSSLVLNGEDEDNPSDMLPDGPLDPGFDQEGDDNQANIGIRFEIIDKPKSRFYIQPGVRFKDPLEPYVRVRYRNTLPLGKILSPASPRHCSGSTGRGSGRRPA